MHPDIRSIEEQLEAIARDARALVADLGETQGGWRPRPEAWSVAECLDHLATGNRVYLDAMAPAADRAHAQGRKRRRPATPGLFGGWFVRWLEPPVKPGRKSKAPRKIRPRTAPPLADAFARFMASHDAVLRFLQVYADLDLAGVRFPNPFIPGLRFSLATGLHVLSAHERRHLWQAWQVRRRMPPPAETAGTA